MFRRSSIIGVDLSDRTIEAVEMHARKPVITRMSRVMLEPGIVEHGRIQDEKRLKAAFEQLFASAKPNAMRAREIVFGLPDEHVFTFVFQLQAADRERFAKLSKSEQDQIVLTEIHRSIPLDRGDVAFGYSVSDSYDVHVVAASRAIVSEWQRFFRSLNILARVFDAELFATFRNISAAMPQHPLLVVDIGSIATHIALFDKEGARFSVSIAYGGAIFTKEVQAALKSQGEEMEDRRVKIGLSEGNEENLFELIKALEPLIDQIRALIAYCKNRFNANVEEIILTGGSSRLPGLALYCEVNVEVPTRVGKPRFGDLEYVTAAGLALRYADPKSYRGPFISYGVSGRVTSSRRALYAWLSVIALVAAGVASFLYFRAGSNAPEIEQPAVEDLPKTYHFETEVPVSIDRSERTPDRADGRVVEYEIPSDASGGDAALVEGLVAVEKDLKAGERLWSSPLSRDDRVIRFLAYSADHVARIAADVVMRKNAAQVPYRIDATEVEAIRRTENENVYMAKTRVTLAVPVSFNGFEEEPAAPVEAPVVEEKPPQKPVPRVLVKETETGWLNVRSGAGPSFSIVTKVNPGERYELLQESGDWMQIKLSDGRSGWAAKRYLERIIE